MKVDFTYDRKKDMTDVFLWKGMVIVDRMVIPGEMSDYSRKKIAKELIRKYEAKK